MRPISFPRHDGSRIWAWGERLAREIRKGFIARGAAAKERWEKVQEDYRPCRRRGVAHTIPECARQSASGFRADYLNHDPYKWLGNGPVIAQRHDLQVTDDQYR